MKIQLELTEDQAREIIVCLIERSEEMADVGRPDKEIAFVTRISDKIRIELAKAKTSAPIER